MTNAKEREAFTLFLAWDMLAWLVRLRTAIIYFGGGEQIYVQICYRCRARLRGSMQYYNTTIPSLSLLSIDLSADTCIDRQKKASNRIE